MKPLVSLIITYYNSDSLGDFVNRSMDFLLKQTYSNIEIICVNDGSTDSTLDTLKKYQKIDDRIILLDKENQKYAQYSKAVGQRAAKGEWCFLIDHDDLVSYDAVEKAILQIEKNDKLDIVTLVVKEADHNGNILQYQNLGINSRDNFTYENIQITGQEYLQRTVGKYEINIRGLVRSSIFKSVSFDFIEPLLNADEIIERQIFSQARLIGNCNSFYTYYLFDNSSAKTKSIKQIDIIKSDYYLRKYFKEEKVYDKRKNIFENSAFRNFLKAVKLYHHFKNDMSENEREIQLERLKLSFNNLDNKEILKDKNSFTKYYQAFLLSNFNLLFFYYKFKK